MMTNNKKKVTSKHMKIGSICAGVGCIIELLLLKNPPFPEIIFNLLKASGFLLIFYYFVLSYHYFKEKSNEENTE